MPRMPCWNIAQVKEMYSAGQGRMRKMIEVGNVRDYIVDGKVKLPPHAVYVGREVYKYGLLGSPLANPFPIGEIAPWLGSEKHRMTRAESVEAYRTALHYAPGKPLLIELNRLRERAAKGDLLLLCWCAPKLCHADVIKEDLEAMR